MLFYHLTSSKEATENISLKQVRNNETQKAWGNLYAENLTEESVFL